MTGTTIYGWDKTIAVGLSGNGIGRKPGATWLNQLGDFKHVVTMAEGKVTASVGTGQGTYKMATGSAASLSGKTFSYVTRASGPGQFVIDVKAESAPSGPGNPPALSNDLFRLRNELTSVHARSGSEALRRR